MDMGWDPLGHIADIRERVNRIFEETMRERFGASPATEARGWAPRVDIYETDADLVIDAELPGLTRDDIDIELDGDRLTIKGSRRPPEDRGYIRMERPQGAFRRSFTIGAPVDQGRVTARYRDGVLTIALPKAKQSETRQTKVKVE
jgi:HSP20 family protein